MQLTFRRLAAAFLVTLLIEAGVFALSYRDLLYLRRPLGSIVASGPEVFAHYATDALERSKVTSHHLETIAIASQALGLKSLEISALSRRVEQDRADPQLRMRLADALRRAGEYDAAEQAYLEVLNMLSGTVR